MKRSKFSEAQIAFVLKQAEKGTAVGEVCRKAGISEATCHDRVENDDREIDSRRHCAPTDSLGCERSIIPRLTCRSRA